MSEKAGKFFISVLFDDGVDLPKPNTPKTILGIDVGLLDVVVCSNGKTIKAPRLLRVSKNKIKAAQKSLNRSVKGSNRRKKKVLALSRLHLKVCNQRKDFNHKVSRFLVNSEGQAFAMESLSVRNMLKNRKLSKSISDVAWGQLKAFIKYKSEAIGKQLVEIDRFYPSSKTCSSCGVVCEKLPLSIREWECFGCGAKHHRDLNAAINIATEGARNVPHGDGVRPLVVPIVEVCRV